MAINPAQMQQFLGGVDYPVSKDELLEHARESGADDNVIKTIQGMDRNQFNSPNDVSEAMGNVT